LTPSPPKGFLAPRAASMPLFYAMVFGARLGGSGTMFDVSSNIVAAVYAREGRPLRYVEFARIGIPAMVVELIVRSSARSI
jgi:Na+/H+ antiporter NhaD/arsenite permease-like protein